MIKLLHNLFNKYFFAFLGLVMFLTYLWFRFIRERLPREIPFNLSILGFFILLEITFIYFFIYISYAGSSNNKFFQSLFDWLFIPLDKLHDFFRENFYTSKFFNKYYSFIIKNNEKIIKNFTKIYLILRICPRLILLSALCVDVFYFHRLSCIYKVLLVGIIILIARFLIYSIKRYQKELFDLVKPYIEHIIIEYIPGVIKEDDDDDDDDIPPTLCLPLEKFMELQTNSMIIKEKNIDYMIGYSSQFFETRRQLTNTQRRLFKASKEKELNNLIRVSVLLEYYYFTPNKFNTTTFFIFFTYFVCWGSILVLSIHTLNLYDLVIMLNNTWIKVPEPF